MSDEMYFVCQKCAHTVLARDPERCENCRSIDLIGFYDHDDAEDASKRVLGERLAEAIPVTWGEYAAKYGRSSLPAVPLDLTANVPVSWITSGTLPAEPQSLRA